MDETNEQIKTEEQEMLDVINDAYHGQTKVEWYEEHRKNPEIDPEKPEKVVKNKFLPKHPKILDLNTATREISDQKANFTVTEYTMKFDFLNKDDPNQEYFKSMSGIRRRQLVINLEDYYYAKIKPGLLSFTVGDIGNKINVNGLSDYIVKRKEQKMVNDQFVYEIFYGTGQVVLEYVNQFIVLIDAEKYGERGLIIEPNILIACDNDIKIEHKLQDKLISRIIKKQKKIVCKLTGQGVIAFLSNIPKGQLVEIELNNEEIRIDGYSVICYSDSLEYSIEFAQKGHLIKSTWTKDVTLFNVFKGTGRVLLSPIALTDASQKGKK